MTFKPGKSGNPSGRPKADPEMRALQALTAEQFKEIANLVLFGLKEEISAIANDPEAPLFRRWMAKTAESGFNRNDQAALEFFVNRLIGKVPDKLEATGAIIAAQVAPEELAERLRLLREPKPEGEA